MWSWGRAGKRRRVSGRGEGDREGGSGGDYEMGCTGDRCFMSFSRLLAKT